MTDQHAADLRLAVDLAVRAGAVVAARYEDVGPVIHKSARDVVTEVDTAVEAMIRAELAARRPSDAFHGEESGRDATLAERVWLCDPVDGTINFANGIPFFCVSLALVEGGRPVVGVVRDPLRGDTFAATAGGPAMLGGRPISGSAKERLIDCVVHLADAGRRPGARVRRVRREIRVTRSMGSAALALSYVANGRFDAYSQAEGLSSWDIAAAGLIAERAGAVVTDMAGGPWFDLDAAPASLGLLAAPPAHHARLLELLREG